VVACSMDASFGGSFDTVTLAHRCRRGASTPSPDYKTLYVISTSKGPGDTGPGGDRNIYAFDVQGTKVVNKRLFTDMTVDGVKCGPDGMRADVTGHLWCSSSAPLGYAGVLVFDPAAKLIGRIRLPEVCANVCFGGPKRDRLFMAASQSLYMMEVATQGAAPGRADTCFGTSAAVHAYNARLCTAERAWNNGTKQWPVDRRGAGEQLADGRRFTRRGGGRKAALSAGHYVGPGATQSCASAGC
jgi:hypothetical protein